MAKLFDGIFLHGIFFMDAVGLGLNAGLSLNHPRDSVTVGYVCECWHCIICMTRPRGGCDLHFQDRES